MLSNIFKVKKRLKIEGLNINKLILKMKQENISLSNIVRLKYNLVELEILAKDIKKVLGFSDISCYNIIEIDSVGGWNFLIILLSRIGVIIGLVLVMIVSSFAFGNLKNFNITIEGKGVVSQEMVLKTLEENNITSGSKMSNINTKVVEDILLKELQNISVVVVERNGVNLNIFIKSASAKREINDGNVVAKYDGIIQEIKFGSGKLLVNIGDIVTKNQILISSGNVGDVFLEANGSIIAKTWVTGEAYGLVEYNSLERTGVSVKNTYYEIFGKRIFKKDDVPNYLYFEKEIKNIFLCENNIFPIKMCVETIHELQPVTIKKEREILIEELKVKAYQNAKNNLDINMQEGKASYSIIGEGNYIKVICIIETMIDIAQRENVEK